MPASPDFKFLLDENVRIELFDLLKENSFDVKRVRGISDAEVADISKKEARILVTNDSDFSDIELYSNAVFSVVLLRVPQSDPDALLDSFSKFIVKGKIKDFEGKFIELTEKGLKVLQ